MEIYMIPGLGFDDRIFSRINLGQKRVNYINWIEPLKKEKLESYANRMSEKINDDNEEVILIGHSFGGIISQEISKQRKIDKIILVSSITQRDENPLKFKIISPLKLHKIITKKLILNTFKYWDEQHGFETTEEQELFKQMVKKHTNNYLEWSLKELSNWNNVTSNKETEIIRIHGDSDKTFPYKLTRGVKYKIEKGSHVMVYKQGELISKIMRKEIE